MISPHMCVYVADILCYVLASILLALILLALILLALVLLASILLAGICSAIGNRYKLSAKQILPR